MFGCRKTTLLDEKWIFFFISFGRKKKGKKKQTGAFHEVMLFTLSNFADNTKLEGKSQSAGG